MKRPTKWERLRGIAQELGTIARRGRQVWRLVPWRHRLALVGALAVMSLASAANTAIPLCLGQLVDAVNPGDPPRQHGRGARPGSPHSTWPSSPAAYLVRECMNVLRRFLVENDLHPDRQGHVCAGRRPPDEGGPGRAGAGPGRRAVRADHSERGRAGAVPAGDVPGVRAGARSRGASPWRRRSRKQPRIALAMLGVVPLSLALTIWQIITQKGIRLDLLRTREAMDGTVVEQLGGHRLRPGGAHAPAGGPAGGAGGRAPAVQGAAAPLRDVALRLRQGDQRGVLPRAGPGLRRLPVRAAGGSRPGDVLHVLGAVPQRDGPARTRSIASSTRRTRAA